MIGLKVYKQRGSALSQYAIILGLIALVLVPVFLIFGQSIFSQFDHFYNTLANKETATSSSSNANNNNNSNNINSPDLEPGDLNGKINSPVSQCNKGLCDIDFGDYVLTGIPENFSDYVESAGTSGGTDQLALLLEQIADIVEEQGDPQGAQDFRNLANLGHFIADFDEDIEALATNSKDILDFGMTINSTQKTALPDNVAALVPGYASETMELGSYDQFNVLEEAAYYYHNFKDTQFDDKKDKYAGYAMYDLYQKIMNDPKYSDNIKGMTKEIVSQINDLSLDMHLRKDAMVAYANNKTPFDYTRFDFETGELLQTDLKNNHVDLEEITHPQIATGTNLRSALICTSGTYDDTGQACN